MMGRGVRESHMSSSSNAALWRGMHEDIVRIDLLDFFIDQREQSLPAHCHSEARER